MVLLVYISFYYVGGSYASKIWIFKCKKAHFPAAISATLSQQFQVGGPDCLSSWMIVVGLGILNPPVFF